jgi:aminopeptidase C
MKKIFAFALLAAMVLPLAAQTRKAELPEYKFTVVKENPITSVKNQNRSGTCWCFSTISFLESEVIRIKNIKDTAAYPDLSEMFVISNSYKDRAVKFVRTDGHISFAAGSEAGDVFHVAEDYGLVPQSAMPGLQELPIHGELDAATRAYVDAIVKNPNRTLSKNWKNGFNAIVDSFLGEAPESFEYNGKTYTPASFRDELGIVPADYVSFTSYTHHPFYKEYIAELGDNWRWDTDWNVPIDEFMSILDYALEHGYTVAWGTDVSEPGFTRDGIAVLIDDTKKPTTGSDQARWTGDAGDKKPEAEVEFPVEKEVTQESRQEEYDSKQTTDDHGMQIFGIAKDQNGNKFYMVKNSWGETGKYKGIWYASEAFVKSKTLEITVHKDAVPKDIKKKLGI